ncbi:MAG: hypothetical protein RL685_1495 [Pseudomonadota bacterium]|jgi:hypothetical protein
MDVLAHRCAECHTSVARVVSEPTAIDDVAALVSSEQIIPLNSAASPLFQVAAGSAPASTGHVTLSASELDLLTSWIDTPRFWPDAAAACPPAPSMPSFDTLLERVAADLSTLPTEERVFQRYLSLAHRASAECAPGELELERQALSKGLNLLSSSSSVHPPLAIDDARTLYRLDLRDFGWQRALELGSLRFDDVWEAVAATSPYSVALTGPAADQARAATGTSCLLSAGATLQPDAASCELALRTTR